MNPLDDLLVAIPCGELGYSDFWMKLLANADFARLNVEGRVMTYGIPGGYVVDAHNYLVRKAFEEDRPPWKRLLWLEHDHEFPSDFLERHASYTQPVVSATYTYRKLDDPRPVAYNWDQGRYNALPLEPLDAKRMLTQGALYEVDCVPMGCTSIRRDVLEQWPKDVPMYMSPVNPYNGKVMTDDIWFCRQAQDQGWSIYLDTSLPIGHRTVHYIYPSFYLKKLEVDGRKPVEVAK